MRQIDSISNSVVQRLKTLRRPAARQEEGLAVAEGEHLVQEALAREGLVRELYVREDALERYAVYLEQAQAMGIEPVILSQRAFDAAADTKTPQGILALAGLRVSEPPETWPRGRIAVALDGVQDPGNVGAVLRCARAVGASFVLGGQGCADFLGDKTMRASMGAVFHLPLYRSDALADALEVLGAQGWYTACGHLAGEDFFARERHEKTLLVIGGEGAGISADVERVCQGKWRLPMEPGVESLNAAVSAGIMLYDIWRQGVNTNN